MWIFYAHFHSDTFFVGRYHTPHLSTDARFFLFPTILVAQVLVGAMGNTPPYVFMGLGTFLLLHLYGRTTLLHRFVFWTRIFTPFSSTLFLWGESDWTDVTLRYVLTLPTFTSFLDLLHTFPNADIHVWFLSQRHSSRCCVLHLDTWGPLFTIS